MSSVDQLVNPTYDGNDILSLRPRAPMPAYDTIPPHPKDGARLVLLEQGDSGYSILNRTQNFNIPESVVKQETINEGNMEESYSKLEMTVNKREDREDGDYGRLETLNIESDMSRKDIITDSEDVCEEARNESHEGHERTVDKVNSEEGAHELENCDSHLEIDNKEEDRTQPLVVRVPGTHNIRYVGCIEYQLTLKSASLLARYNLLKCIHGNVCFMLGLCIEHLGMNPKCKKLTNR